MSRAEIIHAWAIFAFLCLMAGELLYFFANEVALWSVILTSPAAALLYKAVVINSSAAERRRDLMYGLAFITCCGIGFACILFGALGIIPAALLLLIQMPNLIIAARFGVERS